MHAREHRRRAHLCSRSSIIRIRRQLRVLYACVGALRASVAMAVKSSTTWIADSAYRSHWHDNRVRRRPSDHHQGCEPERKCLHVRLRSSSRGGATHVRSTQPKEICAPAERTALTRSKYVPPAPASALPSLCATSPVHSRRLRSMRRSSCATPLLTCISLESPRAARRFPRRASCPGPYP